VHSSKEVAGRLAGQLAHTSSRLHLLREEVPWRVVMESTAKHAKSIGAVVQREIDLAFESNQANKGQSSVMK
jgi:hypothetical protein